MALAAKGRPAGESQSKIARAREAAARMDVLCPPMTATAAVNQIAQEFGASTSVVWDWLKLVRTSPSLVEPGEGEPVATPAPRMTRRTMLDRAWMALHLGPVFRLFDDAMCMAWLRVVLAICEFGDGARLEFTRPGHFHDLEQLARSVGRRESDLLAMIDQAVLIRADDGALELPYFFGLRRRERPGGGFLPGRAGSPRPSPARGVDPRQQTLPPMGMPSPRPQDSGFIQPAVTPDSGLIDPKDSGKNAEINPESGPRDDRRTTTTEELESSCSSSPLEIAGVPEAPLGVRDSGKNDSGKNTATPDPAAVRAFAERVAVAAAYPAAFALAETGTIAEWLGFEGATEALILATLRDDRSGPNARPVTNLRFFSRAIRLAAARAGSVPAAPPPEPPEAPEAPEATVAWLHADPDNPRLLDAWGAIRDTLRTEFPADYRQWLRPMVLQGLDGDEIAIALPSGFIRDWVRDKYGARVAALWRPHYPEAHRVDFRVLG